MSGNWQWSQEHGDYYIATWDAQGKPVYYWAKDSAQSTVPQQGALSVPAVRHDSPTNGQFEAPEYITGTAGTRERLDPGYYVRNGAECHQFFKKGRILAMLWSEAAGSTSVRRGAGEAYTVVRFGEEVYSTIRRFVILSVPNNQAFVYACPITTYSDRGATKPGCNAKDHAAVYFTGSLPYILEEEVNLGMRTDSIEVEPAETGIGMSRMSRINFGKSVVIEKNVKVKDIGRVNQSYMSTLVNLWNMARQDGGD